MQINCVEVSPDGKWFASGAQDSLIKVRTFFSCILGYNCFTQLWDIGTGKMMYTFNLHDAPITCLKFNPYDLTLATGSADKTVKYWDLERFGLVFLNAQQASYWQICSTKPEATGIQCINFDLEARFLFSTAQDALRVSIFQ